jgi:putative ABC transport system permease protein
MKAAAIEFNLDLVLPSALVAQTAKELEGWSKAVKFLAGASWLTALAVFALVFSVTANERRREWAIYRLIGAKRGWLSKLVMVESFFLTSLGAVGGLIAASLIVFPFRSLIFQSLGLPSLAVSMAFIAVLALVSLILAAIIGPLVGAFSVWLLTKIDITKALRDM